MQGVTDWRRRRSMGLSAAAATLAVAAFASPAMASTLDGTAADPEYNAVAGETNNLRVTQTGTTIVFDDDTAITAVPLGCTLAAGDATCTTSLDGFISISLDDGNDTTTFTGVTNRSAQDGGAGNDILRGGSGADFFGGEPGADTYSGAGGDDSIAIFAATPLTVTLDDVANDGVAGEGDNILADVEDINVFTNAASSLTGSAAANTIDSDAGNDAISGGAGNDTLFGREGNDVISDRDGFADRVNCGAGNDTAVVDTLDTVSDCESVQRADVGNANEDRPPGIAFLAPGLNALVPAVGAIASFAATDDRGIAAVQLIDDGRVVGIDNAAPYAIPYLPLGADVGANTLVALVIDSSGQTATAIRPVRVGRFTPARLSEAVAPRRDRRAPYRFRASGRLTLPARVTAAQGCREGVVSVRVKRGAITVSRRRVKITRTCRYRATFSFASRSRLGRGRLRLTARFLGNEVLAPRSSASRSARAG